MADFCKQCGIETWGKDHGDLAGMSTPQDTAHGLYMLVLCEGCGPICVDHEGTCISPDCLEHHGLPEAPKTGPSDVDGDPEPYKDHA